MNAKRIKRVALYVQVRTDHQSVKNQEIELQVVAERHGWQVVRSTGIRAFQRRQGTRQAAGAGQAVAGRRPQRVRSGRGLERRSAGPIADRSCRHLAGIPRQARRLVLASARDRHDHAVRQGDVPDDGRLCRVERRMIHERVMAGLARAKAEGTQLGRPAKVAGNAAKVRTIRAARAAGKSIRTIAREQGVGIGTVSRLTG